MRVLRAIAAKAMALVGFVSISGGALAQTPSADTIVNWAAAKNGGVASVSSSTSAAYPASSLNDGDRTGVAWGNGGGWQSANKSKSSEWAQIAFQASQTIDAVTVYSVADDYATGAEPTESKIFLSNGLAAFDIQVQDSKTRSWSTVASVADNILVKRTITFAPVSTGAIRIVVKAGAKDGAGIVEIEAWGAAGVSNVARSAANGDVYATASSSWNDLFPENALIDGVTDGKDWGLAPDGGWAGANKGASSDHVDIVFRYTQVLHALTLWTLQDDYAVASSPDETTRFTQWGVTDYDVQVLIGYKWTTVALVTSNDLVKRTIAFPPVATNAVRVVCKGVLQGYCRITELEPWGVAAPPPPMLSGLLPRKGPTGSSVTILGANFSTIANANVVKFNGVPAVVTQAAAGQLVVTVPDKAANGPIEVTVNGRTTKSSVPFVVTSGTPTGATISAAPSGSVQTSPNGLVSINNFSPTAALPGGQVTITGYGFSSNPSDNDVEFTYGNQTSRATVTAASSNSLTVTVPTPGTMGPISVTVGGETDVSAGWFYYAAQPGSFTPTSGPTGTHLNVTGANLSGTSTINFAGGAYNAPDSWDGTTLGVYVPSGAQTGQITATSYGITSGPSPGSYTVTNPAPIVSSFSPTSAKPGTAVTIGGSNFDPTLANNVVKFNGVAASVSYSTPTAISTTVPFGATTGPVTVTTTPTGKTGSSASNFTVIPLPTQDAQFVSQSVPTTMTTGQSYPVSVTFKNVGSTTWTTANSYKLGSQNGVDWGVGQRVALPSSVAWGQTVTFNFNVVAPAPGTYSSIWEMLQEGVTWFGATTPTVAVTVNPVPLTISGFSPSSATVGSSVTITGTGFSTTAANNSVTIGGAAATVTSASATSLTVVVPALASANQGAGVGQIAIAANAQNATSSSNFTWVPAITSFTPSSGPYGASITINGTSFGTDPQGSGAVQLNGSGITIVSRTNTTIVASVPSGATSGTLRVITSWGQSATSASSFTVVPPPTVSSISPTSGAVGSAVTITGTNFDATAANNTVKFNGTTATVTAATATSLTVTVPMAATSGTVSETVHGYTVNGASFTVLPALASTFVSQSVPSTMVAGQSYAVTVTMQNTGATSWTAASGFKLVSVSSVDWGTGAGIAVPGSVTTGQNAVFNFTVTAPTTASSGAFQWVMAQNGTQFGAGTTSQTITINPQPPLITSLSPASGPVSTTQVTITGKGFDTTAANNTVTFNGSAATVTSATATSLVTSVPNDAVTGPVVITNANGTSTNPAPTNWAAASNGGVATASSAQSGYAASSAIDGDPSGSTWGSNGGWEDNTSGTFPDWLQVNFATTQSINEVTVYTVQDQYTTPLPVTDTLTFTRYGLTAFDVQAWDGTNWNTVQSVIGNYFVKRKVIFAPVTTSAIRIVANAAADGAYARIVEVEARNNPGNFIVTPAMPIITGFAPLSGAPGTKVRIYGSNLGYYPWDSATINSTDIGVIDGDTLGGSYLVVTIPQGATTGPFTVTVPLAGSATSSASFKVLQAPPKIISVDKTQGLVGTVVTIQGANFDSDYHNDVVKFGGWPSTTVTAGGSTLLTAVVPPQATTGPITVEVGNLAALGPVFKVTSPPPPLASRDIRITIPQEVAIANNLTYIVPPTMLKGRTYPISVVMQNTGSNTWSVGQDFKLVSINGVNWGNGLTSVPLPYNVPPNGTVTFSFNVVGPSTAIPGGLFLQWQMQQGSTPFGRIATSDQIVQILGPPKILSVTPNTQCVGQPVTIEVQNQNPFIWANAVRFFDSVYAPITDGSYNTLIVNVPAGAQTGKLSLQVAEQFPVLSTDNFVLKTTGCTPVPPPLKPLSVTAVETPPGSGFVLVSWVPDTSPGTATDHYAVGRATSPNGPWEPSIANPVYGKTYLDKFIPKNGTYYYAVRACTFKDTACSGYQVSGPIVISDIGPAADALTLPPSDSRDDSVNLVHDATIGTMAGQASTDGGAAQYHVPIVVAPGRAGMQPNLALAYNSRSGNGVMGVGWSISGMSSIHRCPQTPEQDGQTLGVSYTNNDRLCLDGQRLVAVSGAYGSPNTVYRTEIDSYARITQVGVAGASPIGDLGSTDGACFRVEQKDGRILHYGGITTATSCTKSSVDVNSRVKPGGAPAALSWLVEKIEDRVGNNQTYKYTDQGNGEVLLSTVNYTGFGTAAGDRTVTFAYVDRTAAASGSNDMSSSYLAGGLTMQTKALQKITTAEPSGTVRTYSLSYTKSVYSGRLMMTGLQECAGDSSPCHAPTQFTYNDSELSFSPTALTGAVSGLTTAGSGINAQAADIIGVPDLDGDGARETMIFVKESDGDHAFLVQMGADQKVRSAYDMQGAGQMPTFDAAGTAVPPPGTSAWLASPNHYGDMFGDGRSQIIVPPASGSYLTLLSWGIGRGATPSSGTSPFATIQTDVPYQSGPIYGGYGTAIQAVDFDGDGRNDIVFQAPASECGTDTLTIQGFGGSTSTTYVHTGVFVYLNAMTTPPTSSQTAHFAPISSSTYHTQGLLFCLKLDTHDTGSAMQNNAADVEMEHLDRIVDFNGDGRPEFVLSDASMLYTQFSRIVSATKQSNGSYATTSAACSDIGLTDGGSFGAAGDECHWSDSRRGPGSVFTSWVDVNGDGLDDLVIAKLGTPTWQVHLNQGNGELGPLINTNVNAGLDKTESGLAFRYVGKLPMMDVDGDGKPDFLIPSSANKFAMKVCTAVVVPIAGTESHCPDVSPDVTLSFPIHEASLATGEAPVASKQCVIYNCPEDPGSGTLNLPVNIKEGDHSPYHNVWAAENGYVLPAVGVYSNRGGAVDNSIYHLSQLKFYETSPGVITAKVIETPLISRLVLGVTRAEDVHGNGLASLVTRIGCHAVVKQEINNTLFNACRTVMDIPGHSYDGPLTLPDGTPTDGATTLADGTQVNGFAVQPLVYINTNKGVSSSNASPQSTVNTLFNVGANNCPLGPVLPGLLASATNGLNDTAQWGYDSLALGRLCTRDGVAEYSTPTDSGGHDVYYGDKRHYYFASSMPVVSAMLQSNGIGGTTGARSAIYGYDQAMYNHYGRGFQGFRSISVESATGDSTRRLITTTTFNQKFPLVGTVASVVTRVAPSNGSGANPAVPVSYFCTQADGSTGSCTVVNPVHIETSTYQCASAICPQGDSLAAPPALAPFRPVLSAQSAFDYDLNTSALSSHSNTTNSNWDDYGNLGNQVVVRSDDAKGGVFVNSHTTTTTNTFTNDATNWSVGLLQESSVTGSIVYASGHALPGSTSAPDRTVDTQYTWNPDRTPATKTVQGSVDDQKSITTYTYTDATYATSYGLPRKIAVSGPSISPTRSTSYTYSKDGTSEAGDGYFVYKTTNALAQVTTTKAQARDGQVTLATDPNGIQVGTTYDAFGRAMQVTHQTAANENIEQPIKMAVTTTQCPVCANLGEDSNEANVAYRVTTTQVGHPTAVTWVDTLGHTVKHAEAGFSGTGSSSLQYAFVGSLTQYDSMGTVSQQSTPYFINSGTPSHTEFAYDALNRMTAKASDNTCRGEMDTTYSYAGRQTNITVTGTCNISGGTTNGPISMSRSTNVLGQLMQTTDALNATKTANIETTDYWTEPLGHVVAIKDVEGNITSATYNALGQRTQSVDPDQGTWNFTYDALGELTTQTDARGIVTSFGSRDALGRALTRKQTVPTSMGNENLLDTWTYDPPNGIGAIGSIARQRGAGTPTDPQVWKQVYTYDLAARPSAIATTNSESAPVTFNSALSYDSYGRLLTRTYPNVSPSAAGLSVKYSYTAYGQLDALSNATSGVVYWVAQAQSPWGHVIQEKYPGGITGSHGDYDATGQMQMLNWNGGPVNDSLNYTYDSFGNLVSQGRGNAPAGNTETYTYDALQRMRSATRSTGNPVTYSYTDNGNLQSKTDNGTTLYSYPPVGGQRSANNGCGPHAATLANGYSYTCDADGNVIGNSTLAITYDAESRARSVTRSGAGNNTWYYDSLGQRSTETSSTQSVPIRYFVGDYEQVGTGSSAKQTHELGPVIVTRTGGDASTDNISVVLRDRLGSTVNVIDNNQPTTRSYDAFGAARNGDMSNRDHGTLNLSETIHGFTKHEHADDTWLIHMGGRIYDYNLGRFLQVDPVIQFHGDSQAINPYSYIGNNPLSGTDPTGYTVDSRSICDRSPGSCGPINGTDSASVLKALRDSATKSGSVGQGVKGPGGQNTQDTKQGDAGNPNASGNGVQHTMIAQNGRVRVPRGVRNSNNGVATETEAEAFENTYREAEGKMLLDKIRKIDPGYELPAGARDPETTSYYNEITLAQMRNDLAARQRSRGPSGGSPALEGDSYNPDVVNARIKPPYESNPAHVPGSGVFNPNKTVEPANAAEVYQSAIRGGMNTWYGRGSAGMIYRYFGNGEAGNNVVPAHFSGIVPRSQVPNEVLKQLDSQ